MIDRFWNILPALIIGGFMFILVRVFMVYVVMFHIAVQGLGV